MLPSCPQSPVDSVSTTSSARTPHIPSSYLKNSIKPPRILLGSPEADLKQRQCKCPIKEVSQDMTLKE